MPDLTVTLIQTDLVWEDIDANLAAMDRHIQSISEATDLIVLPEMFTTGFSMNPQKVARPMDSAAVQWLRAKAAGTGCDITGSMAITSDERYHNRLLWAKPTGELICYDKKHLFAYAGEDKYYSPGDSILTVTLKQWRIRPFICYDLRFPVWTRNFDNAYDIALFVANWPQRRSFHWRQLLTARAIENQCYVVGVNRVGRDAAGILYSGDSSVITPTGEVLFHLADAEGVHTIVLSQEELHSYRKTFPAWADADRDLVSKSVP